MGYEQALELQQKTIRNLSSAARTFVLAQVRLEIGNLRQLRVRDVRRVFFGCIVQPHRFLVSTFLWQSWLLAEVKTLSAPTTLDRFWEEELKPFYLRNKLGFRAPSLAASAAAILGYEPHKIFPSEGHIYAELLRSYMRFKGHGLLIGFPGGGLCESVAQARSIVLTRMLFEGQER